MYNNNVNEINFNPEKSDLFSLGITFIYYFIFVNLIVINKFRNMNYFFIYYFISINLIVINKFRNMSYFFIY